MISFDFKPVKFGRSVAYLAANKPGITKKEICKLLFFADKEHLLKYGRPITGDQYYALEQGPVPTRGLDALNEKGDQENIDAVRKFGKLSGWTFQLENQPDLRALSKTDVKTLDNIIVKFGRLPAWKLEELSHREPAWIKAGRNALMDFELFFEGHPEADGIKALLIEEQESVRVAQ